MELRVDFSDETCILKQIMRKTTRAFPWEKWKKSIVAINKNALQGLEGFNAF